MATLPQHSFPQPQVTDASKPRKPLALKLAHACRAVQGVIKQGKNGFQYLRITDLSTLFREELFKRGIVIIPNDLECKKQCYEPESKSERWLTVVEVKTEFVIMDGIETLKFCAYGIDSDREEGWKAMATAQTMALKAFLKRMGMIFGENDDAEVAEEDRGSITRYPREAQRLAEYQERVWTSSLKSCGKTSQQVEEFLSTAFKFPVTSKEITGLSTSDFDIAIRWLLTNADSNGELVNTMEISKQVAQNKKAKAQPVVAAMDRPKGSAEPV
jgi:hypothetical protein